MLAYILTTAGVWLCVLCPVVLILYWDELHDIMDGKYNDPPWRKDADAARRGSGDNEEDTEVKKIWKYRLATGRETTLVMPAGSQALSVGVQHDSRTGRDELMLWAMFRPTAPGRHRSTVERTFLAACTGYTYPDDRVRREKFVGTVVMDHGGAQVYHVFEV